MKLGTHVYTQSQFRLHLNALMTDDFAAGAETSARFLMSAPRIPANRSFDRNSASWAALPTTLEALPKMLDSLRVVNILNRAVTPPLSNN